MNLQRFRLHSMPLLPAIVTGAWAGFVPGLFIGGIAGTLITLGAGAALEWMRELSFTTGIQQQLLPFGDRIGLLQTLQDGWWIVIPVAALAVGLFSALIGVLTGALVAATFGSVLRRVEVDVEPVGAPEPATELPTEVKRRRSEEYRRAIGDS
jgi:hypothetical protein